MHEKIMKHLGDDWLRQVSDYIERGIWVPKDIPPEFKHFHRDKYREYIYHTLEKVDDLIGKFETLDGLSRWAKEAQNSDNFEDFFFELVCFENLVKPADNIKLKVDNEGKNVEGIVKSQGKEFYVEMKNLREMSGSLRNKVNKLFEKARDKFSGGEGILFVSCNIFIESFDSANNPILKPDFEMLQKVISTKFRRGTNKNIIAFVLVLSNFVVDKKGRVGISKHFWIVPKPQQKDGPNKKFISNFLEVRDVISV